MPSGAVFSTITTKGRVVYEAADYNHRACQYQQCVSGVQHYAPFRASRSVMAVGATSTTQSEEFDPKTFPSAVGIDILISDQVGEYSRRDLQKIAMDIKAGVPHAEEAFHYVYSRMIGWN